MNAKTTIEIPETPFHQYYAYLPHKQISHKAAYLTLTEFVIAIINVLFIEKYYSFRNNFSLFINDEFSKVKRKYITHKGPLFQHYHTQR